MKEEIKNKLDEHIRQLLDKPALSAEDYAILKERFREIPAGNAGGMDWALPILLMMMFSNTAAGKKE